MVEMWPFYTLSRLPERMEVCDEAGSKMELRGCSGKAAVSQSVASGRRGRGAALLVKRLRRAGWCCGPRGNQELPCSPVRPGKLGIFWTRS